MFATHFRTLIFVVFALASQIGLASELSPPTITNFSSTLSHRRIQWTPFPAAERYTVHSATNIAGPFIEDVSGSITGFIWTVANTMSPGFYQLSVTPLSSNALLTANILNRLAYGPTPDELERVGQIGPQAFIDEQLAPELLTENLNTSITETTNGSTWVYVTATGTGSSSTLYLYLTAGGTVYIDDIKLVRGTVAEAGVNLLPNGDFEAPLTGPWQVFTNYANSQITSSQARSGGASLQLTGINGGAGNGNSVLQVISPSLSSSLTYTLSYWYLPSSNRSTLIARLSGSGIDSRPDTAPAGLFRRLNSSTAGLSDLRAWYCLHAVGARRQLLEVLTQFLENHFVTQYAKSRDYFDRYYDDGTLTGILAADLEFREISRWRNALLNPNCTFYDLLRISAESPAMIVYLDTVDSRGNGSNIANENYARELLELFTFGVDNGYDQNDITVVSRAWTGWSVRMVDAANTTNPFAPQSTTILPGSTNTSTTTISNLLGVFAFNYRQDRHNTNNKVIFPNKTVEARFGPPWAGRNYQLSLPARSGTGSFQDGYDVIRHLADQPYTQEYLSVKLCRWFVHDEFEHGVYDYRDTNNLSPEAALVRQCMLAWENSNPKGQIRAVLRTIFDSDLFRSHGGSMQKVKTPLEFVVSSIRALRSANTNGGFTANTDGFSLSTPLSRMGAMQLFDRSDPDGYPEAAPGWISAGTLAERLRFAQSLLLFADSSDSRKTDSGINNISDPVGLLRKKLPGSSWMNAGAVVDYFLSVIYPGEGAANLNLYRHAAVNFLDTADNGTTPSPFVSLSTAGTPSPYEVRVRAMVAMLMTFQRFQEQ